MRELKFRCWDGEKYQQRSMLTIDTTDGALLDLSINDYRPDWIVEQFTGLHDRDGKEIYEGDIVRWRVNNIVRTAPVYYDEGSACFWMGIDSAIGGNVLNDWLRGEYEVIGNIHTS